jgi:hypothetical protein
LEGEGPRVYLPEPGRGVCWRHLMPPADAELKLAGSLALPVLSINQSAVERNWNSGCRTHTIWWLLVVVPADTPPLCELLNWE